MRGHWVGATITAIMLALGGTAIDAQQQAGAVRLAGTNFYLAKNKITEVIFTVSATHKMGLAWNCDNAGGAPFVSVLWPSMKGGDFDFLIAAEYQFLTTSHTPKGPGSWLPTVRGSWANLVSGARLPSHQYQMFTGDALRARKVTIRLTDRAGDSTAETFDPIGLADALKYLPCR